MSAWLQRVAALVRKELLAILKDPSSRAILFAPAIMQTLIFGYAATFDLARVPYALLDQSRSRSSAELVAKLDSTETFRRVADLETPADIAEAIDTGRAILVVQIGPRFDADLAAGRDAVVQLILDARNSTTAATASAAVGDVVDAYNRRRLEDAGERTSPTLRVETRAWFNPQLETRWNFVPALIASLSILQTLLLTALSVAREREQGTFDQLLVTPLSPTEIMIGKALPSIFVGLVQATLVLLIARWWFAIPMAGSLATLYLGLFAFMLAGVGVGLAISALSATMQQAMFSAFVLLMPMVLLSGLTTPVENMPPALRVATYANPLRFGIDLVRRVYLEGVGFAVVWPDLIPLAVLAAVSLPTAAWLFRHRLA